MPQLLWIKPNRTGKNLVPNFLVYKKFSDNMMIIFLTVVQFALILIGSTSAVDEISRICCRSSCCKSFLKYFNRISDKELVKIILLIITIPNYLSLIRWRHIDLLYRRSLWNIRLGICWKLSIKLSNKKWTSFVKNFLKSHTVNPVSRLLHKNKRKDSFSSCSLQYFSWCNIIDIVDVVGVTWLRI